MKCPECGATLKKISRKCSECGALLKKKVDISLSKKPRVIESAPAVSGKQAITLESAPTVSAQQTITLESAPTVSAQQTITLESAPTISAQQTTTTQTPSLIEFPGINKNALPEWRKELSERVREKQERRAREALLEAQGVVTSSVDTTPIAQPILELLPQTEMPPLNPIVEAALKRIERAHLESTSFSRGNAALATAVAYEGQPRPAESDVASLFESSAVDSENKAPAEARPAEKIHNLAVVPNPTMTKEAAGALIKKPKRLLGETNDPALDYLDTVPTALLVESRQYVAVSAARRALAAIVDLAIMFALSSPLLALNGLTELNWQNWRVIAFSAGGIMLLGFFYLTIVTALTGRTVGMRLCSLRVVDARNGLIPTGSQSAGRALIYLLSLASAGILSLYVFVDSQRHTLQDRFTRTTVIRA